MRQAAILYSGILATGSRATISPSRASKCAYAKVALGHEVMEVVKAVKDSPHQGVDGRDLEQDVVVLGSALGGEEKGQCHNG